MDSLKRFFVGYGNAESSDDDSGVSLFTLSIAIVVITIFSVINAIYDRMMLCWLEAGVAVLLAVYLFFARKDVFLPGFPYILIITSAIVFTAIFVDGGIGNQGVYWTLAFPFMAFLLAGVRRGWIWIGMFSVVQCSIVALYTYQMMNLAYSLETLMIAAMMFLFFTIVANVVELQNEKYRFGLMKANCQLKNKEEDLRIANASLEQQIFHRTRELQETNTKLVQEVKRKELAIASMKQSEMKFEHAQRMESLGTLVGGIAHDFNNMLSGITANLYLAQRYMQSDDGKKRLDKISDLSMHAADMIKQLLTFARKDAAEMKPFDLNLFIREAFKLATVSISEHIECRSELPRGKIIINGNATQIQQMLMNLMNNARDALSGVNEPAITVSLSTIVADKNFCDRFLNAEQRPYVVLSVKDNGMGISEDQAKSIFDPFFTTKEVGKGTGLGLAMIYGAIQSHQGLINMDSSLGSGTCFNLYFPLVDEEATKGNLIKQTEVVIGAGETILLVDDDLDLCECHSELLKTMGYNVLVANNGMEACQMYQRHDVALIIMDVVMPVLGGVAASQRIRKFDPDALIVFATGYDKMNEMTSELVTDWQNVLHKPFDLNDLSGAIRKQLDEAPL